MKCTVRFHPFRVGQWKPPSMFKHLVLRVVSRRFAPRRFAPQRFAPRRFAPTALCPPTFCPPAFRPLWRFILTPLLMSSHKFWFLYEDCVLPPEIFHCVLFANIISLTYSFSFRKGCFRGPSSHYWSYFYNETKSGFRVLSVVSSLELSNCCEDKKSFG